MKLIHPEISFTVDFTDDILAHVCMVESPVRWREIQKELTSQYDGGEGQWVLSDDGKELKLGKEVEMVFNPLQLEENSRKVMTAFLKSLSEQAVSELYWREGQELNSVIQTFFGKLETEYSFGYTINAEIDFSALAKSMGIQIETEYDTDLERLVQYCILIKDLMKPKLFIFWNLRNYFSQSEMELFYDEISRREWKVLLMENSTIQKLVGEKWYIIDKDNCEIY